MTVNDSDGGHSGSDEDDVDGDESLHYPSTKYLLLLLAGWILGGINHLSHPVFIFNILTEES